MTGVSLFFLNQIVFHFRAGLHLSDAVHNIFSGGCATLPLAERAGGSEIGVMKEKGRLEVENARLRGDLLTMASRIGHDLRTPLGGIVGAAEVLRDVLAERKMPATLTQAIFDSADDMTRLIRQVCFVAKATGNPLRKEPVQMGAIVRASLERLESRILKRNATIVEPETWPQVNGVATWLEVVWWNFLANALQHTAESPRVELSWKKESGACRFGISDNGGGVRDEIRPRLFQPFDSLHQADGGQGLGLPVVQRLIELQEGVCGYEPRPGGSFFFFSLPDNQDSPCHQRR